MNIGPVKEAAKLMREAMSHLANGPLEFYLEEMAACYDLLMTRYAPFKVGDRVELSCTPNITPQTAHGWMACKHFLVEGSKGTVREATCGSGGFRFGIVFDDDSWIDRDGKRHPVASRGMFMFSDGEIRACSTTAAKE